MILKHIENLLAAGNVHGESKKGNGRKEALHKKSKVGSSRSDLISTVASARWPVAFTISQLFQQFRFRDKPLKTVKENGALFLSPGYGLGANEIAPLYPINRLLW